LIENVLTSRFENGSGNRTRSRGKRQKVRECPVRSGGFSPACPAILVLDTANYGLFGAGTFRGLPRRGRLRRNRPVVPPQVPAGSHDETSVRSTRTRSR